MINKTQKRKLLSDDGNIINANSRDFLSEENALILNSLEEPNNPVRAIFAVARLNEGWDVLNLYDIVRINEGATKTKATTYSGEAQLIGRGSRYYPFEYEGKESYTRRFDFGVDTTDLKAKVKPAFKRHPIFKDGKIYINFINDYVYELRKKYNEVYLIRNERKVKIVEIDGTRGFMTDFLLYLQDENCTYQIFLEPKGDYLRAQDKWKEDFLTSLGERNDVEVLTKNEEVRLLEIKFYSETPEL